MNRQAYSDSRSHGLLDEVHFAGPSVGGRVLHGPFFDLGDARGYGDDHSRHDQLAVVYLLNEVPKHRLGNLKVGDDAVFHGSDGDDVAGGSAEHALGFFADC